MAEVHIGPLPEGMKQCRVCAEPINLRATKCIHCDSEQGSWRLRAGISSNILALLIALLSVLTTAAPILKNALTPDDSRLVFSLPAADKDRLALLVSNNGLRAGMLQEILLKTPKAGATLLRPIEADQHTVYIVEPGRSSLFEFAKPTVWLGNYPFIKFERCEIVVSFVNFTGRRDVDLFECPQGTRYFLNDASLP
jgi:hypothetical protein